MQEFLPGRLLGASNRTRRRELQHPEQRLKPALRMETYKELEILPENGIDLQEIDPHYPPERIC